jgi:hypothetical protein
MKLKLAIVAVVVLPLLYFVYPGSKTQSSTWNSSYSSNDLYLTMRTIETNGELKDELTLHNMSDQTDYTLLASTNLTNWICVAPYTNKITVVEHKWVHFTLTNAWLSKTNFGPEGGVGEMHIEGYWTTNQVPMKYYRIHGDSSQQIYRESVGQLLAPRIDYLARW